MFGELFDRLGTGARSLLVRASVFRVPVAAEVAGRPARAHRRVRGRRPAHHRSRPRAGRAPVDGGRAARPAGRGRPRRPGRGRPPAGRRLLAVPRRRVRPGPARRARSRLPPAPRRRTGPRARASCGRPPPLCGQPAAPQDRPVRRGRRARGPGGGAWPAEAGHELSGPAPRVRRVGAARPASPGDRRDRGPRPGRGLGGRPGQRRRHPGLRPGHVRGAGPARHRGREPAGARVRSGRPAGLGRGARPRRPCAACSAPAWPACTRQR